MDTLFPHYAEQAADMEVAESGESDVESVRSDMFENEEGLSLKPEPSSSHPARQPSSLNKLWPAVLWVLGMHHILHNIAAELSKH